jgi:hypothetical protein
MEGIGVEAVVDTVMEVAARHTRAS